LNFLSWAFTHLRSYEKTFIFGAHGKIPAHSFGIRASTLGVAEK